MSTGKALILGGRTGLLGQEITSALQERNWETFPVGRNDLDIFDGEALENFLQDREITHIFNCVAYTRVEEAEEDYTGALYLNRDLPGLLGKAARRCNVFLVHFSTDFVFDGKKKSPYLPEDPPNPLNIYGKTKLAGEKSLLQASPPGLLIIRTAWLFGPGKENFVSKILRLGREKNSLDVIHDQIGSPTYTVDLARYTLEILRQDGRGVFHIVNSGEASWCELAAEALSCVGLQTTVRAVDSSVFAQKAKRPAYSVLDTSRFFQFTSCKPRPWAQSLRDFLYHTEIQ